MYCFSSLFSRILICFCSACVFSLALKMLPMALRVVPSLLVSWSSCCCSMRSLRRSSWICSCRHACVQDRDVCIMHGAAAHSCKDACAGARAWQAGRAHVLSVSYVCACADLPGVKICFILQLVDQLRCPRVGWPDAELVLQQQVLLEPGILLPEPVYRRPALIHRQACAPKLALSAQKLGFCDQMGPLWIRASAAAAAGPGPATRARTVASPQQTCETAFPTD